MVKFITFYPLKINFFAVSRLTANPTETPYLWKAIVSIIYTKIMRELCIQREIFNYPTRWFFYLPSKILDFFKS